MEVVDVHGVSRPANEAAVGMMAAGLEAVVKLAATTGALKLLSLSPGVYAPGMTLDALGLLR